VAEAMALIYAAEQCFEVTRRDIARQVTFCDRESWL